jgi:acetoin utilization deacetylase AcuC-like enzyme
MPPFFRHDSSLEHDTGFGHPERPDRIRAIEGELERREWLGWERVDAPPATEEQLLRVHPRDYVDSVREHCARGRAFDVDTPTSPASY